MFPFPSKRRPPDSGEKSLKLKKLDKIYIGAACILILAWGLSSSGLLSKINFKAISPSVIMASIQERQANNRSAKSQVSMSQGPYSVCTDGEYIYYIDYQYQSVYRMNRDGSNGMKLLSGNIQSIYLNDGWLYYSEYEKELGRIRIDGTEKSSIIHHGLLKFAVQDNYIYFNDGDGLWRTTIDGKDMTPLSHQSMGNFSLYGKWIYYTDAKTRELRRLPIDGGEDEKVLERIYTDSTPTPFGIYKNYIYYVNGGKLFRTKINEYKPVEVRNNVYSFFIEKDTLYSISPSKNMEVLDKPEEKIPAELKSSRLDGSDEKKLLSEGAELTYLRDGIVFCSYGDMNSLRFKDISNDKYISLLEPEMTVAINGISDKIGDVSHDAPIHKFPYGNDIFSVGDDIYYISNLSEFPKLLKFNKKTKAYSVVSEKAMYNLQQVGNLIFHMSMNDNMKLYCINLKGENDEKVFDFPVTNYVPTGDAIYFTSVQGKLYRYDFESGNISMLTDDMVTSYLVDGSFVYYTLQSGKGTYRIDGRGTNKTEILDFAPNVWNVVEGSIYFMRPNEYFLKGKGTENYVQKVYKTTIGSSDTTAILEIGRDEGFLIYGKHIFFKKSNGFEFYSSNLRGGNIRKFPLKANSFIVVDDYVYLYYEESGYQLLPLPEGFR